MPRSRKISYESLSLAENESALGVDEAGRGPVLGPLVVAAVLAGHEEMTALERVGVTDSKKLSPGRRVVLADQIRSLARATAVRVLEPPLIDEYRSGGRLDYLEVEATASLARELGGDLLVADALGAGGRTHRLRLERELARPDVRILAENRADARFSVVAAASILAKTIRDEQIAQIAEEYGEVGSGYPSDPTTVRFLETWRDSGRPLPPFVRKSWATILRIFGSRQETLF